MPFGEAIELLKNSVGPPLQMTVIWRDLLENADVEPATPIEMDPLSRVEVKTALELMLKTVSRGLAELGYRIQGNVIVIGTAETIETPQEVSTPPRTEEADIQELAAWRRELRRNIQAIEMNLASTDARQEAIEKQMQIARHELADKQAGDEITRELAVILKTNEELLSSLEVQVQAGQMSMSGLAKAKADVAQVRIDLARRREELAKSAGGSQLSRFSSELSDMAIEKAEGRAKLDMLRRQFDETQAQLDQAAAFDPRAARIRAAREAVDAAEFRLATLKRRLASLEPPAVIVIGAK
jgi:chromosome segregation ATPase